MVKNLSTIDRGTKIRLGRWHNDDQADNTIVINASDTPIQVDQPDALYMKPIRTDERDSTLMTGFNINTFEIVNTGLRRDDVAPREIDYYANIGNTLTSTLLFTGDRSFTTTGTVGISNVDPIHTLDVGSKFYVDDIGSNVLTVLGDTYLQDNLIVGGNLDVRGSVTAIDTVNTTIKDAIIEIGKGNVSSDMGIIMDRTGTNVALGYRDTVDEFVIAYTGSSATSSTITPSSELIDVRVHGRLHVNSNLTVDTDTFHVDAVRDRVGINTLNPQKDFDVVGEVAISSNLTVNGATFHVDTIANRVGINTVTPSTDFHVEGKTYVSGNVTVDTDTFHVDTVNDRVGINTLTPTTDFHVEGNTYVTGNVDIQTDLNVVGNAYLSSNIMVTGNVDVQTNLNVTANAIVDGNLDVQTDLNVTGNAYMSSNVVVTGNVDVQTDLNVIGNAYVSSNAVVTGNVDVQTDLNVIGNAYVSSNAVVTGNVDVQTDLNVVGNTYISSNAVVTGNVDVQTNLNVATDAIVAGNVDVQTDLTVTGNAYMSSNVIVTGNVDVQTNLNVATDAIVTGNVDVQTDLTVTGNAYMSSNVIVTGNVDVQRNLNVATDAIIVGNVDVQTDLNVTGNAYMSSNVIVTGNVDVQTDLNVTGNAYMSSNVIVTGNVDVQTNLNVATDAIIVGNVDVQTDLNVTGNAYMSSNIVVTGNADVQTDLNVTGNAYMSSNVVVTGNVDVQTDLNVTGNVDVQSELNVTGNVFVDSNVMVVGNVHAATYYGDGGLLSNVTLQVISDYGNTTSNTIQFTNPTTAFTTDLTSNVSVKVDQLHNVNIDTPLDEQILIYDGTDWVNEFPVHTYIKIRNDTAATIDAGDAVYVRGAHNANIINVGLAQSNAPSTMPCIGLSNQILTAGQQGTAVAYGKALSVATSDFVAGETVYVSNTVPGGLTNVKPFYTDSVPNLIQNVGVVTKIHASNGSVFVTGIGRANDVPNAQLAYDNSDINWVYVNNVNNDFKKIEPSILLTKLQTLEQVVNTGNTVSNIINVTGLTTTANVEVGSNISVAGLADPNNKYFPMVNHDGFFQQSPVYLTDTGKYVISASEAEFLGNITLSGNTTILNSESVTISDRIFGVGANNSATGLDSGFMIEHQHGVGDYANVGLIHHASDHRFAIGYTQNTFSDDHILYYQYPNRNLLLDIQGNLFVQNALTVTQTSTFADDLTVGAASNLFVDVSTSRVGINEATPDASLDVNGDVLIQSTVDASSTTSGALRVSGGVGVVGNVYATRFVGDGAFLENIASNLEQITENGNVTTGTIQFTNTSTSLVTLGSVGIANTAPIHDLDLGSNLFMEDTGSNVVHVTGNIYATRFVGDGAFLENIASNLEQITENGNVTTGTIQFTNTSTSLVTLGSVGIANTVPIHDLDLGSNLFMEDTGSNVVHVTGNIYATRFIGDGAFLENIASNLEQITENGNVTTGTIQFTNATTSLVTLGSVGIANTAPIHDLNVGSNLYVEDAGSNVVHVTGNVYATRFIGDGAFLENIASNLHEITTNGNVTTNTVQFTNAATALITTGKVGISTSNPNANLHVTGNAYVSSNVEVAGNVIVDGGLIVNRSGLTRKTYGYSGGVIADGTTPEINVVFDSQLFSAKITAHLVENTSNISVLNLDVMGGTGRNIGKGFLSIVGDQNSKHWDSVINTTDTTVTLIPSVGPVGGGSYGISVEYTSPLGTGGVTSIDKDHTNQITFSY